MGLEPCRLSISRRAGLMTACLRTVGEWTCWAQLLHQGGPYWPTGLAWPLANAATLLRYAMGEGAIAVVGPHPDLVGRVLPAADLPRHDKGVNPDVVPPTPSPHLTSRHATPPHPTPPHLTSPHLTSPHFTLPDLTSPHGS